MLVVTTTTEVMNFITWYLDTRCLNHMICNKKLLIEFDRSKRTKVKLVETIQRSRRHDEFSCESIRWQEGINK